MPTKTVTSEVMESGGGKHWTKKQIAARKAAESKVKREKERGLFPPAWLSAKAKVIWRRVMKSVEGLGLLDNMDTESLAIYCDINAKYQALANKARTLESMKDLTPLARIQQGYAEKLGLTPNARARLIKKLAEKSKDSFGEKFD